MKRKYIFPQETPAERIERRRFKADARNLIDVTLLLVVITLFGLVATIKPELMSKSPVFTLQLVLSMPFFMCCLLARIKEATYPEAKLWYKLGYVSFTLAYGLFVNSMALLLSFIAPTYIALVFLVVNTLLTLVRGGIEIYYKKDETRIIVIREICHVGIIVLFGVIPIFCS
jgi:hypothetical protein